MNAKINFESNPTTEELNTVKKGLDSFNFAITGQDNYAPLSFVVKDEHNAVIGGIMGCTYWNWLYIDRFWIEEKYRKQGIGRELLSRMEAEAVRRGCGNVHLDTHDFQALDFYRKMGYTVKTELKDLPKGHSKFILLKRLYVK